VQSLAFQITKKNLPTKKRGEGEDAEGRVSLEISQQNRACKERNLHLFEPEEGICWRL